MTDPRNPESPPESAEIVDLPNGAAADSWARAGAAPSPPPPEPSDSRPGRRARGIRWAIALVGVAIVAALSVAVVSLVGGRPVTSPAMGWVPADAVAYTEYRLDLPGDQREKLAAFLKPFPGFSDSSSFDQKLDEALDKIVRLASSDKQAWTTDIEPWFGGHIAMAVTLPDPAIMKTAPGMASASPGVYVVTIRDRAKTLDWVRRTVSESSVQQSTYGDADLLTAGEDSWQMSVAVNDQVLIAGSTSAVKSALDTNGTSGFVEDATIKTALSRVQSDYALLSVVNVKALGDFYVKFIDASEPDLLAKSQIDETVLGLLPAWQASVGRFESDALVSTSIMPSIAIGHDSTNRADEVVGHVPAKSIAFLSVHDAGEALTALVGKARALPETADAFRQFDQVAGFLGGFDSIVGWWGDAALVVTPLDDGTIGAGLVIKNRNAADANRLVTTLNSFLQLGGATAGLTSRTADHNGTPVTVVTSSSFSTAGLPPGYKNEFAWASNADITVVGYGESFVDAVLDANGPTSLAGDPRFAGLLGRVGNENMGISFVDIAAIRALVEPLARSSVPPDSWAYYEREIQPYLEPFDAVISTQRKDGTVDRGTGQLIVH